MMVFSHVRTYLLVCFAGLCLAGFALAKNAEKPKDDKAVVKKSEKSVSKKAERDMKQQEEEKDLLEWLKLNFPKDAERLEKLKAEESEVYKENIARKWRKFKGLIETTKKNPELGRELTKDIKLIASRDKELRNIANAKNEKQKAESIEKLKDIVSQRFDLGIKIKQLRYEELQRRIERMRTLLVKKREEFKKLEAKKDEEIAKRMTNLLENKEKIDW